MQFCVEEALVARHHLEQAAEAERRHLDQQVMAAQERTQMKLDRIQGRLH